MTREELQKIIENHAHWINEDCDGWENMRANLYGTDLREANLCRANLYRANLSGADLSGADLRGADLYGADLRKANLCRANLYRADLREADLYGADLREADLRKADLYGANLRGANLYGADLSGAKNIPFIPMACPDTGAFIGWKKCVTHEKNRDHVIVKLLIPEDARRSSATTRKCRCDKAVVLEIQTMDGEISNAKTAYSTYNDALDFAYRVGETVTPRKPFDEDRFNECASGIHFFINRQEAVNY